MHRIPWDRSVVYGRRQHINRLRMAIATLYRSNGYSNKQDEPGTPHVL